MPGADFAERPLALVAQAHGRLFLAAVDALAAGEGLGPGLPLAEARALVPDLETAPLDPAGDGAALVRLAEWCGRYTPWTAIDTSCGEMGGGAPGSEMGGEAAGGEAGILLDITGCAHLFGGEAALLSDLIRRLGRFGFAARAALAESAGAAWAVARFGDMGARAWRIVPPGSLRAALAPLPPAALRLGAATLDLMARLGLRRVGDLYDLPPATLAPRFGPLVGRRLAQALGHEAEPISPRQPVPPCLVRRVFAEPIATPEDIARGLEHLLGALARRLEAEQRGARRLELGLYRVDGTLRRLALGTSRARRDPAHLARLFAEHLDKIDPGFGIEVMTLAAPVTETLSALQMVLAEGQGSQTSGLADLIDRLGSRLGLKNVVRPHLRESHVPERAVTAAPAIEAGDGMARWLCPLPELLIPGSSRDEKRRERGNGSCPPTLARPLGGGREQGVRAATSSSPLMGEGRGGGDGGVMGDVDGDFPRPHDHPPPDLPPSRGEEKSKTCLTHGPAMENVQPWAFRPRPVRLLPRPEPVEAIALLPDHAPARFRWRRLTHAVVRAEGPERIESEWWLEPAETPGSPGEPARDYFRVEAEDGRRYWLYRAAGRWFLHGVFA